MRLEPKNIKKDLRTHQIIGAAMEVHNIIGPGHLVAVYQECLEIEFKLRNISFITQHRLEIFYKDQKLRKFMFLISLFIVYDKVIVEIKAEKFLTKIDETQLINSLIISHHSVGLLLNFGEESLRYKRFIS